MHETDEYRAFLNQILDRPDDDEPRLIFADWLEEQGSPRGEFIRVQCQLAQLSDLDPQYAELQSRSSELVGRYGHEWSQELKQDYKKIFFHRGFIVTLTVLARSLAKVHDELFSSVPVRWLRLNRVKGAGQLLVESGAAGKIRYLDLMNLKVPEDDLLALLAGCSSLRGLKLGGFDVLYSSDVTEAMQTAPFRETLEELELQTEYENYSANNVLAETRALPNLTHLKIAPVCGQASDFDQLSVPSLKSLKVQGNLDVSRTRRLTGLPLGQLEELSLHSTGVPQAGLSLIAESGVFETVRTLDLSSCDHGIRSMELLFDQQNLQHCESLDLRGTRRLAESASGEQYPVLLGAHGPLKGVKRLQISHLKRGQLALALSGPALSELEELRIEESSLHVADVEMMAQVLGPQLKRLHLVMTHVTTETMQVFARRSFSQLFDFRFNNEFTYSFEHPAQEVKVEDPIIQILASGTMPRLCELSLQYLRLSPRTLDAFYDAELPHLRVFRFDGNEGSNEHIFRLLRSEQWDQLRLLCMKGCRGLRRGKKISEEFGLRLVY